MLRGFLTLFLQITLSIVTKSIIAIPGITYRYPTKLPIRHKEDKKNYLFTLGTLIMLCIALILTFINSRIPDLTEDVPRSFIQSSENKTNFESDTTNITGLIFEQ